MSASQQVLRIHVGEVQVAAMSMSPRTRIALMEDPAS